MTTVLRLIKYHNRFQRLDHNFSNCGTNYEVLPFLFDFDTVKTADLRKIAEQLGFELVGNVKIHEFKGYWQEKEKSRNDLEMHMSVALNEVVTRDRWGDNEKYDVRLGLIALNLGEYRNSVLDVHETLGHQISDEKFYDILNNQEYSISDRVNIDNTEYIVNSGWDAYHYFGLLGYESFDEFCDRKGYESIFDDQVFTCGECGKSDWNDSGYTYNFRIIGCEQFGINCGCAHDAEKQAILEGDDEYINNPEKCIESETLDEISDHVTKIQTYIGGMVDPGRGGYIDGEHVSNGQPETVMSEYLEKNPDSKLICVREDSGQFQTYWSLYKLNSEVE